MSLVPLLLRFLTNVIGDVIDDKKTASDIIKNISSRLDKETLQLTPEQLIQLNLAQQQVNKASAYHRSLFAAGWRPMAGWSCSVGVFWLFVAEPLLTTYLLLFDRPDIILPQVPGDLLFELILGMLGMAGIRSFDKLRGITR
jgi:hypothetical protein